MGVHFGASYVAVCAENVEQCVLTMADHYPTFSNENIYQPIIKPEIEALGKVTTHKTQADAVFHLKEYIYQVSGAEILLKTVQIEELRLSIDDLRLQIRFGEHTQREQHQQELQRLNVKIRTLQERVKQLRAIRRQKIELTFPK